MSRLSSDAACRVSSAERCSRDDPASRFYQYRIKCFSALVGSRRDGKGADLLFDFHTEAKNFSPYKIG
jgi:hypothetical protein